MTGLGEDETNKGKRCYFFPASSS